MTTLILIATTAYLALVVSAIHRYRRNPQRGDDWLWSVGHYVTWLATNASPRVAEWFTGSMLWLWGFWVAVFDAFNVSTIYANMASTGTSAQWGAIFVALGMLHGLSRLLAWPRWLRSGSMLFVASAWAVIAVSLTLVDWRLTSTAIYGALAALSLWAYLRIRLPVIVKGGTYAVDQW